MIDEKNLKHEIMASLHKEKFQDYKTGAKGIYYLSDDLYSLIDSLPKIGEWIPCSERLPENDNEVLVWYRYKKMQGINIVGSAESYGIGYYYNPTNSWLVHAGFGIDQNVVAWMPLPEPYKTQN